MVEIVNLPMSKDNLIIGTSPGTDFLEGRAGKDVLISNAGHDFLDGGPGHDVLIGGDNPVYLPQVEVATFTWDECNPCPECPPPPPEIEEPDGDTFHFRMCDLRNGGSDLIVNWTYDYDHIDIGRDGRRADIEKDQFVYGNRALDADDRVVYNLDNGKLWIDPDGSGNKHKILVARLIDNSHVNPYEPGSPVPHLFWNDVSIPEWLV